jgi:hypothetical protein
MFGTVPLKMCAACYEDEFATLAQPNVSTKEPDWYFRDVVVPTCCTRCTTEWGLSLNMWPFYDTVVVKRVHLSARVLADVASLHGKCQASVEWGTKPANAELQLNNLLAAERESVVERAHLTVGAWAIREEMVITRRGCCTRGCFGSSFNGTPWKRWNSNTPVLPGGSAGPPVNSKQGPILDLSVLGGYTTYLDGWLVSSGAPGLESPA